MSDREDRDVTGMKLNDAVHDHIAFVRSIADRLNTLSWALDVAGLTKMATELGEIADGLPPSAKRIAAAHSEELRDRLDASKANAGLMLKAILVGAIQPPSTASDPKHQTGKEG